MKRILGQIDCPAVDRISIAWTCVATDDPNPLHLDRDFAVDQAGFPDVVAPGTMLMGWIGECFEEYETQFGDLTEWSVRFLAPLGPGEQVRLSATVDDELLGASPSARCTIEARTQDDRLVARASACFTPPPQSERA